MSKVNKFVKDQKLAKKQGVPKGADPATHERCVHDLKAKGHSKESAIKICNAAGAGMSKCNDVKEFVKKAKLKKSESFYGYKNTQATVSTVAQAHAETASPELIQYISASLNAEVEKIRLAKGTLTVSRKDEGLYSAFFANNDGQVVDEFENCTVEMLAKNLMVKGYYDVPVAIAEPVKAEHPDEKEDEELIREKMNDHIALFHQGQQPGEPIGGKGYVRIKYGNFELEIKKSMSDFIKAHKSEQPTKSDVKKALSAWRRNSKAAQQFRSDFDAAQALVTDWNQYGEDFSQVLHAIKMKNEK